MLTMPQSFLLPLGYLHLVRLRRDVFFVFFFWTVFFKSSNLSKFACVLECSMVPNALSLYFINSWMLLLTHVNYFFIGFLMAYIFQPIVLNFLKFIT